MNPRINPDRQVSENSLPYIGNFSCGLPPGPDKNFPQSLDYWMLSCPAGYIREAFSTSEWHHCSGWFNKVPFYDGDIVEAHVRSDEGQAAIAAVKPKLLALGLDAWERRQVYEAL